MEKIIVSISGGKDSTALYLLAMEKLQGDFTPVFANTGNEHEITLEFIDKLPELTGGPKIQHVSANFARKVEARKTFILKNYPHDTIHGAIKTLETVDNYTPPFIALCLCKGMFPNGRIRFCTSELKAIPIHRHIYAPFLDCGHTIISWQCIRADESIKRSRVLEREKVGEGVTAYRPLLKWTAQDVFSFHKRHGVKPNKLYSHGFSRVGCMPCFMSRKSEIAQISRRFPAHIKKIREWEDAVSRVSKTAHPSFFPRAKIPGMEITRANIDNVVAWARGETPGQEVLPVYIEDTLSCQSEYGLCE